MTQTPGTAPDAAPDISPAGGPRVDRRQMRDLTTLRRSKDNRMVAGVCEGLSRHFDIDPIVIRVVFAALTIFGGAGLVLYALAWLTIPEEGAYDSPASGWLRRDPERILVAGLSIAAVAAVATMIGAIGVSAPNPFPAVVVGLAALAVFALFTRRRPDTETRSVRTPAAPAAETTGSSSPAVEATSGLPSSAVVENDRSWWRRDPKPPQSEVREGQGGTAGPGGPTDPTQPLPPGPRTRRPPSRRPRRPRSRLLSVTIATVAITLGAIWVLDETVVEEMEPSVYPGTALGIISVALLLGSWFGRSRFLIVLGLVASVATVATTVIGPGPHGESLYRPTATAEVESSYDHGVGHLVLRLDDVADVAELDGRDITIDMSVGQVDVIVPTSVDATITAHVTGGDISGATDSSEREHGSQSAVADPVDDADPDVTIDVDLRFGQINLMRLDCPGDTETAATSGLMQTYDLTADYLGDNETDGGTRVPSACN